MTINAGVKRVIEQMTADEIAAHRLCVLFDTSHAGRAGSEKIAALLTEEHGTRMDSDTRAAFLALTEPSRETTG